MGTRKKIRNAALIVSMLVLVALIGISIYNGLNATSSWASFRDEVASERAEDDLSDMGQLATSDSLVDDDAQGQSSTATSTEIVDIEVAEPEEEANEPESVQESSSQQDITTEESLSTEVAQTVNGSGATGGTAKKPSNTASGAHYSIPSQIKVPRFNESAAQKGEGCAIDMSSSRDGYIAVRASSKGKLKVQLMCGQMSYNYPLPNNNTVIYLPTNMGSGKYKVRVMLNTSGTKYVQLFASEGNVNLSSQSVPYSLPNYMVWYGASSKCVAKARELAKGCSNQGEIARSIYTWLTKNIKYDNGKASWAASAHDYIPNPDSTLSSKSGICFDYASLAAAMFRSLGIPCKIVTGNVSPNNVYHAWNMVLINGEWKEVGVYLSHGTWGRIDTTFAAGGVTDFRSYRYSERYTY